MNFKQAIIDKCLKSSSTQRNENLIKLFDNASKKYDELLSLILQNESREEIARVQETINDTEIEIPEIEKEISGAEIAIFAMEQSEEEIDKELEQDKEQMSLYKDNEKELKKIKKDLDSSTKELQVKNYSAAEQENSIADINKTNNDLIRKCEELIASKIKLQDNAQLLEIESENLSTLVSRLNFLSI